MASDPNGTYTYRNSVTGQVESLPARFGDNDPSLERVEDDAKPLAYTPIPHEAVEEVLARRPAKPESHEDAPRDKAKEQ